MSVAQWTPSGHCSVQIEWRLCGNDLAGSNVSDWPTPVTGIRTVTATHGLCWCSVAGEGAGEPSDQRRTGISSTVGSNALPSVPRMGEASSPAPQGTASPCGTKNITCGNQGPAASSLRYPCFDSINDNEPASGAVKRRLANATRAFSIIRSLPIPASAHSVRCKYCGSTLRTAGGLKQFGARSLGFQNSASPKPAAHERSTKHTKPFLPLTPVS